MLKWCLTVEQQNVFLFWIYLDTVPKVSNFSHCMSNFISFLLTVCIDNSIKFMTDLIIYLILYNHIKSLIVYLVIINMYIIRWNNNCIIRAYYTCFAAFIMNFPISINVSCLNYAANEFNRIIINKLLWIFLNNFIASLTYFFFIVFTLLFILAFNKDYDHMYELLMCFDDTAIVFHCYFCISISFEWLIVDEMC